MVEGIPWYQEGLRFSCTQCGKCCTGSPGFVWVNEEEISEMAQFLKISPEEFIARYTRLIGNRLSLLEHRKNYDCVFLQNKKECRVYGARPKQCRTFPWWKDNLTSPQEWQETAKRCEGIHQDAPLISVEEIQKNLD
jgi:Fe-S-cluster containining protein